MMKYVSGYSVTLCPVAQVLKVVKWCDVPHTGNYVILKVEL